MNWYESFKNKVTLNGTENTIRDKNVSSYYDIINYSFKDSLSYFQIYRNDDSKLYDVWILDEKAYKSSITKKKIVMKPNDNLYRGDIITWNNQKWLTINIDEQKFPYNSGIIQFCNHNLKTILPTEKYIEYPCCITQLGRTTSLNIEEKDEIIQPKTELIITAKTNDDIINIPLSWRLIFGSRPYRIDDIDDASEVGITKIRIRSDIKRDKDDFVKGIADNSIQNNTPISTGNLTISGNSTLNVNKTGTYTVVYTDGTAPIGVWTISNTTKASIISQTNTSVTLKGLVNGQTVLQYTDNNRNTIKKLINVQNGW